MIILCLFCCGINWAQNCMCMLTAEVENSWAHSQQFAHPALLLGQSKDEIRTCVSASIQKLCTRALAPRCTTNLIKCLCANREWVEHSVFNTDQNSCRRELLFASAGECKKGKLLIKLQRGKNLLEWRDDGNWIKCVRRRSSARRPPRAAKCICLFSAKRERPER